MAFTTPRLGFKLSTRLTLWNRTGKKYFLQRKRFTLCENGGRKEVVIKVVVIKVVVIKVVVIKVVVIKVVVIKVVIIKEEIALCSKSSKR